MLAVAPKQASVARHFTPVEAGSQSGEDDKGKTLAF